ncbi:MAG: DUF4136 domain-containing protein [Novosphingobium sp.]
MSQSRLPLALLLLTVAAGPDPVSARPGGWGGPGWSDGFGERGYGPRRAGPDAREGKVEVSRFLAEHIDPSILGHGAIGVAAMPGSTADARAGATFEAAVVDQLAKAGYDTMAPSQAQGQVAEVSVIHDVVRPEEAKRSPVSGETTIGVGTHGSYMGMAINVDMTKPAKALVSTRLVARIRDRATNAVLWEGRADIVTRDGDNHWTQQAIATRLAAALFEDFPARS